MKRAGKEKKIIMKLYFGNTVMTVTTLMILALLGFIGYSVCSRAHITFWGRRSAVLLVFGLAVCCFAAARDGLDKTIQHAIDGSCAPGLFPAGQRADRRRLHRRGADNHCRRRHAHRKNAAGTRDMVLHHVRRRDGKDRDDGACKDDRLKPAAP